MTAEDVMHLAAGNHPRDQPSRIARNPDDHRRTATLVEPERDLDRREPQVPLRELARPIVDALHRVRRHEQRTQLRVTREPWLHAEPGRKDVISVEDWAEIR